MLGAPDEPPPPDGLRPDVLQRLGGKMPPAPGEALSDHPLLLIGAAEALDRAGDVQAALALYRAWMDRHPEHPVLHAIAFNHAMLLSRIGDLPAARAALRAIAASHPAFVPAQINLGMVEERLGALPEAVQCWQQALARLGGVNGETLGQKRILLKQLGRVFESTHFDPDAEDVLRQSLDVAPQQRDVLQHWLNLRQRQCKWPVIEPFGEFDASDMRRQMSPLTLAAYTDDPWLQLANARENAIPGAPAFVAAAPRQGPIRVGYLSSDLREHAVGHLICEVFALHDREAVRVHAYYTGHAVDDAMHRQIKASVDRWHDVAALDDAAAAALIRQDGIDVLVDVNGYTHGSRAGLLRLRPAPVIVNWLGFPGTCGSPDHDYILADDFIVPPRLERFYSERVARLPCYQPNNRGRERAPGTPSRAAAGLPERGVVYCCFNGGHKLTPPTWQRWMSILRQVDDSILWLMQGVKTTSQRLLDMAGACGIAPERIVFAPHRPNAEHLARIACADLFLDTWPYGAHTTASDALWMGVPIVTLSGRSFASRVCGSLVTAAGLGELVCHTPEQYVALAVELGRSPERRQALRSRLGAARAGCVLFDTPGLVRALEGAFRTMMRAQPRRWAAAGAGRREPPYPAELAVPDGADAHATDYEAFCHRHGFADAPAAW